MNNWRILFLVFMLIFFQLSCANNQEKSAEEQVDLLFPAFKNFPQELYYDFNFDLDENECDSFFSNHNFKLQESAGANYYWCAEDSTEFIVPENAELNSFKIIFRSQKHLTHSVELIELFKSKSSESAIDKEFSIFTIDNEKVKFKLTFFSQKEFIRLSFTKNRSI